MKSKKQNILDFFLFAFLSIGMIAVLAFMTETFNDPITIVIGIIIIIPTVIALVSGAPFVPTPIEAVKKMLALAEIKEGEKVYDIGCGDGRMVYLAAKDYKANATGFELSPFIYLIAKVRQLLWKSKAKILFRDFRSQNLSDADVILCYLLPEPLAKLQNKLDRELKKGARVISYAFRIGSWEETYREERKPEKNIAPIWVYER